MTEVKLEAVVEEDATTPTTKRIHLQMDSLFKYVFSIEGSAATTMAVSNTTESELNYLLLLLHPPHRPSKVKQPFLGILFIKSFNYHNQVRVSVFLGVGMGIQC